MSYTFEKIGNMVFLSGSYGIIYKAWDESEFTEKKLQNAMKKIKACDPNSKFTKTF